jgi:hypothetical protein
MAYLLGIGKLWLPLNVGLAISAGEDVAEDCDGRVNALCRWQ